MSNTNLNPNLKGYRKLGEATVDLVNDITQNANELGILLEKFSGDPDIDQRWLAISKTTLQQGFMFLKRAIMRPENF